MTARVAVTPPGGSAGGGLSTFLFGVWEYGAPVLPLDHLGGLEARGGGVFATTHWSVVLRAGDSASHCSLFNPIG